MYIGRLRLGEYLPLRVLCRDGNNTPTVPTDVPQATVYDSLGFKTVVKRLPIMDRYGQTGLFGMRLFLDDSFSPGYYTIVYYYHLAAPYYGMQTDQFEVIAGGNADGSIISMTDYVLPNARFLVSKLDCGKIFQGRNPFLLTAGNPSTGAAIATGLYRF